MNKENFFTLGYNFDDDFREDFGDMDKKDVVTPFMKEQLEMLKEYGNRNKLLQRPVYYITDYIDDNCGKKGVIRGPHGTFYLDRKDMPPGIPFKNAYFSFSIGGPLTGSFMGMYLIVEGDEGNKYFSEVREFGENETEKVNELYSFLLSRNRRVEREGNTLYLSGDAFGANKDIEEFEKLYEHKVKGYVDYLQQSKYNTYNEVRDDDTFGD